MISWFARNPIAANLLMVFILFAGIYTAFYRVPLEVEPSWKRERVEVDISYPGSTAKDVERGVILPIEAALDQVEGIKRLRCTAESGSAEIIVDVNEGYNTRLMLEEIQTRIEAVRTLPDEIERPRYSIPDADRFNNVLWVTITGNLTQSEFFDIAERVRDDLLDIDGISTLRIWPGRNTVIAIEAKLEKLEAYNLGFSDLSNAIRRSSIDLPAGSIRNKSGSLSIRTKGQAYTKEDFERIPVRVSNGAEIQLGEIAKVVEEHTGRHSMGFEYNGEKGISIRVFRTGNESAIDISNKVRAYAANAANRFPEGIKLYVGGDDSERIRGRLGTLTWSLVQGCGLILILLGLFLRPKLAFWVLMGIPVSFAGAVMMMPWMGISANITSLFGFLIALGLVVDDAIVTGENIYTKVKEGMDSVSAAIEGTKEVAVPVTFGAMTTIVAFLPLYFLDGEWGQFARQIPPIVGCVLIFSLVESKLVLPSHLTTLKKRRLNGSRNLLSRVQNSIADGLEWVIQNLYRPSLNFALKNRPSVIATFLMVGMILTGYTVSGRLGFVSIPEVDRPALRARYKYVQDGNDESNQQAIQQLVEATKQLRSEFMNVGTEESIVKNVFKMEWDRGGDTKGGMVYLSLMPQRLRTKPGPKNSVIVNRWRELVGEVPEGFDLTIKSSKSGGMEEDAEALPIEIELRGPDSEEKKEVAFAIAEHLKTYEDIVKATAEIWREEQDEIEFTLKPRALEVGLTQRSLAQQIRQAFYGEEAQRLQRDTDEVRVMVRLPEESRESLHTLEHLRIRLPDGTETYLANVAQPNYTKTPSSIDRLDGANVINITAQPRDEDVDIYKIAMDASPEIQRLVNEVPALGFRFTGQIAENKETQQRILIGFCALLLAIYGLLAIPFKSLLQPIYVMLAVPFGLVGAAIGHIVMGITPSYLSLFGVLALTGVVVNDSLVLVDFINRQRRNGVPLFEAVSNAGARRFRPIFLTSITTVLGLLPLLLDKSQQAQFLIPMAVSLAAGILVATLITLYLIPCVLLVGEDCKKGIQKAKTWYTQPFKENTLE
jgi:multidrug efflux pump subunit AcrB